MNDGQASPELPAMDWTLAVAKHQAVTDLEIADIPIPAICVYQAAART